VSVLLVLSVEINFSDKQKGSMV